MSKNELLSGSAFTRQHVKEQLQRSVRTESSTKAYRFCEYLFDPPLPWPDAQIAVEMALCKGWIPDRLEYKPSDGVCVTMLRLVRPANSTNSPATIEHVGQSSPGRNSAFAKQANTLGHSHETTLNAGFVKSDSNFETTSSEQNLTEPTAAKVDATEQATAEQLSQKLKGQLVEFEEFFSSVKNKKLSQKQKKTVETLFAHFSVEQLCEAMRRQPDLPFGKAFTSIIHVYRVLGIEPPDTLQWLRPYHETYTRVYGGLAEFNFGQWTKPLLRCIAIAGHEKTLEEFESYLTKTSSSFVSALRFAAGLGTWSGGTNLGSRSNALVIEHG